MSGSREAVLGKIKQSLSTDASDQERRKAVQARISDHARNLTPKRTADLDQARLIDLLETKMKAVDCTVQRLASMDEIPAAVADYLKGQNLPATIRQAPHSSLANLPWSKNAPMIEVSQGRSYGDDLNSLTACHAAVAETGTLMLESGAEGPTTLNFLPDNHIVVVRESQVTGTYEDGWDRLREKRGGTDMPRALNMITGPSRTGDIEQTIFLGAHGPRSLHVLIVKD